MAADMGRLLCCCVGHEALGYTEACLMAWTQAWEAGSSGVRGHCRSTGLVSEPETVELLGRFPKGIRD